jgi:MoaA/NifB/PqqE/SkfB family radical SAM enzyme
MEHVLFPITYDCNLNCSFCSEKQRRNIKVNIDKCVGHIKTLIGKVAWVYVTGGEPFLVPNLCDVLTSLKDMGFKVGVTTNGTINRPEVAGIADRLGVSLDGDKDWHNTYRGDGVFEKAVSTLIYAKEKCETVVMSVSFKDNGDALKRLSPIVKEINPTYWQIQRDRLDPKYVIPVI